MTQVLQGPIHLFIFYLVITKCRVETELFTALVEIEELFETELVLIKNLDRYIQIQSDKLMILQTKLTLYKEAHNVASVDISSYISNPINAFLLIKRLTTDWDEIEDLMSYSVTRNFLENVPYYRQKLKFPTDEDLNGAAVALMRLQDTYNLKTSSIVRGELNGLQFSVKMLASDCFELGRQSQLNSDYYHTELWMREAMKRLVEEEHQSVSLRANILEYFALATYKQGNLESALQITNELLELIPDKQLINFQLRGDDGSDAVIEQDPARHKVTPFLSNTSENYLYEQLCRNEIRRPEHELAKLHCRYVTNKSQFLKIAPLKLEEAHLDPDIVIYHEIMYDNEIELLKTLAKPRLVRASVINDETDEETVVNSRIAKLAWLEEDEHRYIQNVELRVEDMTGLTIETAETLQVMNYGIGGHFLPHLDYASHFGSNIFERLGSGNRIATVLFYMSDVPQGGATVFPMLNTAVWPKKGTAIFWMNLYKSGEGNDLMFHGACPVLIGNKWVSTKWLHSVGQEKNQPCGLKPDHPPNEY